MHTDVLVCKRSLAHTTRDKKAYHAVVTLAPTVKYFSKDVRATTVSDLKIGAANRHWNTVE